VIDILIFGLLLMFGMFYSMFLEVSEERLQFVTRATWITVVAGTGATLALVGLFEIASELAYWKIWAAFACTGGPVVVRSLLNHFLRERQDRKGRVHSATP